MHLKVEVKAFTVLTELCNYHYNLYKNTLVTVKSSSVYLWCLNLFLSPAADNYESKYPIYRLVYSGH